MDSTIQKQLRLNKSESSRNGLLFGLVAGLGLAVSIWGWDALLLSTNHGDLPWLKFVLGLPVLVPIAAVAGWFTARLDHAGLGAIIWILVGAFIVWIAGHMPFEVLSSAIGFLDPDFAGLEIFPYVENIRIRMRLLFVIVAVLSAIGGALEMSFVEAAGNASTQVSRIFRLGFCLIIFIPVGMVVDNLINADLRLPIIGTNKLIHDGLKVREGNISKEAQRELGIRALRPFGDQILSPYRLKLGYYSSDNLEETIVHVDFSGVWGSCSLIRGRPFVCRLSSQRYLKPIACLLEKGSAAECRLLTVPGFKGIPSDVFSSVDSDALQFGIRGQFGTAVLAVVEDGNNKQVVCLLRDNGDVILESCQQTENLDFDVIPLPPTSTPKISSAID